MRKNFIDILEQQELIQKLVDAGYGHFVDKLLSNESKVYTKKGRLNKSGACRVLEWKPKELEEMRQACREVLGDDVFD